MRIGLDSTDSRDGGCTTHVALAAWSHVARFAVLRAPRLVRLNPNIPHKTRGNGALCLDLGHPVGPTRLVGEFHGRQLRAADALREPDAAEHSKILDAFAKTIDELRHDGPHASSGLVAYAEPPSPDRYHEAVSRHVAASETRGALAARAWGDGRGLIGAVAACAWPARRGTRELILYRDPARIGSPRRLREDLGPRLDAVEGTFDNWDPVHRHLRVAPASPCPILCGIRGTQEEALIAARSLVGPETASGWALFETNQATGDHLRPLRTADVAPYDAALLRLRIVSGPRTERGGHVFVDAEDDTGRLRLAAYEPTKGFRDAVRSLAPGDDVIAEGGVHEDPGLLALEAVTVAAAAPRHAVAAPMCPACGAAMRSEGRRGRYQCPTDGTRSPAMPRTSPGAAPPPHRVTVPVAVRRHLQRPNGLTEQDLNLEPLREALA